MDKMWKLERLTFGLRHSRSFAVSDKLGDIIDQIVPLQGSGHFPSDCFAKVSRPDSLNIELKDDEDTMILKCGVDGIILECDMLAEPPITPDKVYSMFNDVVNKIVTITGAKSKINRLGIVFKYSIKPFGNSAKELFSNLLKIDLKGTPDNINIRMALKNPSIDALYHPDKKTDFQNAIIEVSSQREDEKKPGFPTTINISVDYQMYYEPNRSLKEIDIKKHFREANDYIETIVKKSLIRFESK